MLKSVKSLSIILVITLVCLAMFTFRVQASDVNMNLSNTAETNTASSNTTTKNTANTNNAVSAPNNYTNPTITTTEEGLGLSNTLNIILIVIGILLVLLAIAIIIRLKK